MDLVPDRLMSISEVYGSPSTWKDVPEGEVEPLSTFRSSSGSSWSLLGFIFVAIGLGLVYFIRRQRA